MISRNVWIYLFSFCIIDVDKANIGEMHMIHFTVGTITRPTSLGGALKHFGVSSTLRRRIKHNGICTINGQAASTRDFVQEGDEICVTLPEKNPFPPEDIPIGIVYEDRKSTRLNSSH